MVNRLDRVRDAISLHCRSGLGSRDLRIAIIRELRRALEFGGHVWVLTDPLSCVGVDPLAHVPGVQDLGRAIRVTFEPGPSIECDIAGDKMILRARAQVRDFFERSGSRAGDTLRFMRVGEREFLVRRSGAG